MMSFEILEGREQLRRYYPQWEALFRSHQFESSLSIEWTDALLHSHLAGATISLIVLKDKSGIAGIVPLYTKEVHKRGVSLKSLVPVSEHFNTHSDILVKNTSYELITLLLQALSSVSARWDVFRLNRVVENHPILATLQDVLNSSRLYHYHVIDSAPSFFIELGSDYEQYLKTVSKTVRYKLKHAPKKLQAMGGTTFYVLRDLQQFDRAYDTIASIENRSWKTDSGSGITANDQQRQFYRQLFKAAAENGRLRLWILQLGDLPIAYEVGVVQGETYDSVHGSYDEEFRRVSPGTVLFGKVIEDLISEGVKQLDFFGDLFEWQQYWTDMVRRHKSVIIYNNTLKARLFYSYNCIHNRQKPGTHRGLPVRIARTVPPRQK